MASRRDRLHKLLDLARAYRGWSRVQLARALNRDTTRLYSDTEDPKFSLVVSLADVLEWPMDAITEFLWTGNERAIAAPSTDKSNPGVDFAVLYKLAQEKYMVGDYAEAIEQSQDLLAIATTPVEVASAYNVAGSGWEGLGRYTKAASAFRAALMQPLETDRRFVIEGNLANTHYTLWDLSSAVGITSEIIAWYGRNTPSDFRQRVCLAFARYVRGNARRRYLTIDPARHSEHVAAAQSDLAQAKCEFEEIASEADREDLRGLAHTCEGGLVEIAVELEEANASDAIEQVLNRISDVTDPSSVPSGNWLESYGWWCIFGGNIALRNLKGPELQRCVAVFANKALEIGELTQNWAFRERVLTMEHLLRKSLSDSTGFRLEPTIDEEDMRLIAGTMGRFPNFQRLGWEILTTAKVVQYGRRP